MDKKKGAIFVNMIHHPHLLTLIEKRMEELKAQGNFPEFNRPAYLRWLVEQDTKHLKKGDKK